MFLFIVQSHKNPDQLARLAHVLLEGCPDSTVLISHDFRATKLSHPALTGHPRIHIIEGKGGRGDFEIVAGYLAALRYARDRIAYEWVTNLSGQDYPVFSLAGYAAELSCAGHDGFLHHFDALLQNPDDMLPMAWPPKHGHDRYYYRYSKLKESLSLPERAALRLPRLALVRFSDRYRINTAYGLQFGRRAGETPFTQDFRCYAGSYWHTIRRRCAEYLLDFADANPAVMAYLENVLIPDECVSQTILVNEPRFRFVSDNRRYYDMRGSKRGHPKVLTRDDAPQFLDGRHFFARKFEPSSGTGLLDELDRYALRGTITSAKDQITLPAAPAAPVP